MGSTVDARLGKLGIELPAVAAPAANYIPFSRSGNLVLTSGQLPFENGKLASTGLLGQELTTEQGRAAARACAINVLAVAKSALGSLDNIASIVKITVFVASDAAFTEQHLVANGASDLFVEVLGEAGRHARSAVGMASLPLNAPVEVEAIIEAKG